MAARRVRSDLIPSRRDVLLGAGASLALPLGVLGASPPDGDWIDFDDSHGLISLAGEVNGHPANLTLDSGAGRVVIDHAFARRIGLASVDASGVLHGLADSRPGGLSSPVTIRIGEVALDLANAVLADLSAVRASGYEAPVLVGRDLFELMAVDLDFVRKRVAFRPPGSFDVQGFHRVPMRARRDLRQIQLAVEGRRPVWGSVDLGSGSPLAMSQAYARSARLLDGRPRSAWVSSGVDGITAYEIATARRVDIAGAALPDVPFDIYPVWNRAATAPVNIGYPLLRRLGRIILDYRSDSLFADNQAPRSEPFGKNRIGLALVDLEGGGYRVAFVAPGSPGAAGGWRAGEVVAAIDGDRRMPAAVRSTLSAASRVVFTMADGSVRELFPAQYY